MSETAVATAVVIAIVAIIINIILFVAIICTAGNTEKTYKELQETNKRLEMMNKNLLDTNMILINRFSQGNNYNKDNNSQCASRQPLRVVSLPSIFTLANRFLLLSVKWLCVRLYALTIGEYLFIRQILFL